MNATNLNVVPLHARPTLAEAVCEWISAKRDEDAAKARRLACEELICELQPPKTEGSTTVQAGDYKLTLTGSFTYKVEDLEALRNITAKWDSELVPLTTKVEASAAGCKWLRENRPELWLELSKVVSVKPAKVAVKVSV